MNRRIALAIGLAIALSTTALSPEDVLGSGSTADVAPAASEIPWSDLSLDEALDRARDEGRKVFAVFHATWCGPCKRLAKEVFRTAEGARAIAGALPLRLDVDDDAAKPFVRKYRVRGLPTTIVFKDGEVRGRIRGFPGRSRYLKRLRALLGPPQRDTGPTEPSFSAH